MTPGIPREPPIQALTRLMTTALQCLDEGCCYQSDMDVGSIFRYTDVLMDVPWTYEWT